jgi:hypothetical protein
VLITNNSAAQYNAAAPHDGTICRHALRVVNVRFAGDPTELEEQLSDALAKTLTRRKIATMIEPSRKGRTGKLMALIQFRIDPVVVEEIVIGTIGAIASVVGAILVIKSSPQDRGGPTKAGQRAISILARRLSMIVAAQDRMSDPLNLRFTLSDPAVTLLRIEIANQLDKGSGNSPCVKEAPRVFVATVEPKVVLRWYNATPYWDGETKQLPIRVSFLANGLAESRTIWVRMSPRRMSGSRFRDDSDFAWFLEGPCPRALPSLARMPGGTRIAGR